MFSNKPLQYESLKCVLQYMEPNLRYQLSSRVPSIRVTEKLVPLMIDSVSFDLLTTRVNDTTYLLGIYREYPVGHWIPKEHQEANATGGYRTDLTEHGFEVEHHSNDMTPGDLDVSGGRIPHVELGIFDSAHQFKHFEQQLKIHEKSLFLKLKIDNLDPTEEEGGLLDPSLDSIDPLELVDFGRQMKNIVLDCSVETLREKVKQLRAFLTPYRCRRDNTPLPYTQVIQLTVESPRGTQVYRHPYNMKLQEAMKKLNTVLFRGHNSVCYIRSFNITSFPLVIRLPEGLRVRIRKLQVLDSFIPSYNGLKAIIEESSYPLDALTIFYPKMEVDQFNHPIVKSAQTLNIHLNRFTIERDNFQPILCGLENKNVNLSQFFNNEIFPVIDQVQLIQQWVDQGKDIGTTFSYEVEDEKTARELLSKEGNSQKNSKVLPMSNGNNLEIQCAPMDDQVNYEGEPKWKIEIRVVAGPE